MQLSRETVLKSAPCFILSMRRTGRSFIPPGYFCYFFMLQILSEYFTRVINSPPKFSEILGKKCAFMMSVNVVYLTVNHIGILLC